VYLQDARYCYLRWEAAGKVRQLEELYPHLREEVPVRGSASTIGAPVEHLDLATVIKASQAVSGEIVLENLIKTLMVIAVEHAGAERGLLILPRGEEHRIEAEARTGHDSVEVSLRQSLVTPSELPESLLRYVIRTQESVILDDASVQNQFSEDEYLRQRQSRSVLCLALVKQAKLIGVLYLENNLAPRVFTSKRLEMLELLASQAAISLDHAQLYAGLRRSEAYLAKANEALRGCLDTLASVPELDDFLGQVMAVITRQLGAVSSTLRVLNLDQNTLTMELLFQDGRVMSPAEAKFPESWRSLSLDEQRAATFLDQPTTVARILDPHSPIPEALRFYLFGLGIRTLLIIPLTLGGRANGQLSFRFTEERDFDPAELEIARALATQASLAIQLTRLAKTARQSAVLEERNRLAGEIHDALAQSFTGISMQLELAEEEMAANEGGPLGNVRRAKEIAKFGLAEARRSVFNLRSSAVRDAGFVTALQRLVERSSVTGRVRCDFRSDRIPEQSLPTKVQHELLRIAQEAISNAVRHAKPTVVTVTLCWDPPNLILRVKDNGSGISSARLEKSDGVGLDSMRDRAAQIDAKLEIQTAAGHGTSIIVTAPISP
jgi:signal transduction histidine kinase